MSCYALPFVIDQFLWSLYLYHTLDQLWISVPTFRMLAIWVTLDCWRVCSESERERLPMSVRLYMRKD